MKASPLREKPQDTYTDAQVINAILNHRTANHLILKWFFNRAREYALGYLQKSYTQLDPEEWDVIFANTNLKIVSRFRKGLNLGEAATLRTYYTSVAKFAALDFVRSRKADSDFQEVVEDQVIVVPTVQENLEQSERLQSIRAWLVKVLANEGQVEVLLLHAKGFSYQEMLDNTTYNSEGACRNALMKGKKKISEYLLQYPVEARKLRALLEDR
ncbi:sigma-70 RNA polymerase sigma factor region 4 domain-containing protein [Flavilitoribacter nigricans]|uniref:Sigma-70 family RNA polymerase sigma factor n=1 Tax=Flavilitoribacter nigricans (strain ATCC 23147 / DSM 23189 / NBRC 102662 / NCIMB 1420 / SS-2) TaxID=1122177 RepID=A0A2D0ND99_FLAN2|nr:sigma-70 family RNA polymerase sigma factor [Flavilitoribacter nigricans]PHN06447.1 hypothetical protein CRP01_12835 [Flavilitoribacter nigricans DSM 23189 = NBRC 102662]